MPEEIQQDSRLENNNIALLELINQLYELLKDNEIQNLEFEEVSKYKKIIKLALKKEYSDDEETKKNDKLEYLKTKLERNNIKKQIEIKNKELNERKNIQDELENNYSDRQKITLNNQLEILNKKLKRAENKYKSEVLKQRLEKIVNNKILETENILPTIMNSIKHLRTEKTIKEELKKIKKELNESSWKKIFNKKKEDSITHYLNKIQAILTSKSLIESQIQNFDKEKQNLETKIQEFKTITEIKTDIKDLKNCKRAKKDSFWNTINKKHKTEEEKDKIKQDKKTNSINYYLNKIQDITEKNSSCESEFEKFITTKSMMKEILNQLTIRKKELKKHQKNSLGKKIKKGFKVVFKPFKKINNKFKIKSFLRNIGKSLKYGLSFLLIWRFIKKPLSSICCLFGVVYIWHCYKKNKQKKNEQQVVIEKQSFTTTINYNAKDDTVDINQPSTSTGNNLVICGENNHKRTDFASEAINSSLLSSQSDFESKSTANFL